MHRVVTAAAADDLGVGAAQVEDEPPRPRIPLPQNSAEDPSGLKNHACAFARAGVVEVDPVAAAGPRVPVADAPDELAQRGVRLPGSGVASSAKISFSDPWVLTSVIAFETNRRLGYPRSRGPWCATGERSGSTPPFQVILAYPATQQPNERTGHMPKAG